MYLLKYGFFALFYKKQTILHVIYHNFLSSHEQCQTILNGVQLIKCSPMRRVRVLVMTQKHASHQPLVQKKRNVFVSVITRCREGTVFLRTSVDVMSLIREGVLRVSITHLFSMRYVSLFLYSNL